MATWLDKMIGRVRDASTTDEARDAVKDYIDPVTGERVSGAEGDEDGDTHVHIHLEKGGEGGDMNGKDQLDPNDPTADPEGGGPPDIAELAQMVQQLMDRVEALEGDEEGEMELEDPDTKDARRFTFRRGSKMKARDEGSNPTPEVNEEMMGETDLPGIEDLDKRMKSGTGDRKSVRDKALKMTDSADMEDNWRDMVAISEIIQPGIRVGTFDSRLPVARQAERMCSHRRRVVDSCLKDEKLGSDIVQLTGLRTVDGAPCDAIKVAFNAIGAMAKIQNNDQMVRSSAKTSDNTGQPFKVPTIAEMNAKARDFWKNGAGNGSARR